MNSLGLKRGGVAALGLVISGKLVAGGLSLSDATRNALGGNAGILSAAYDEEAASGRLQASRGAFDPVVSLTASGEHLKDPRRVPASQSGTDETSSRRNYSLEARTEQPLRSGITVGLSTELERQDDELSQFTPELEAANYASVGFSVDIPLGQGLGADEVAAGERSAELERQALSLQYGYQASLSVADTVEAYWSYRASRVRLQIARDTEERGQQLAKRVRMLVEADERPAADLELIAANVADNVSDRIRETRELNEARTRLGQLMGLDYSAISALPPASNPLPDVTVPDGDSSGAVDSLIARGTEQRLDLKAQALRRKSARVSLEESRLATRPNVDLELGVRYRSLQSGDSRDALIPSPFEPEGPSINMSLTYQWPVGNNTRRGRRFERQAQADRADLVLRDLRREIGAAVRDRREMLILAAAQVRSSRRSLQAYRRAVANESERYQLGAITLIDLLDMEDRLAEARLAHVARKRAYAIALTRLLEETGELVVPIEDGTRRFDVRLKRLLTYAES